MAIKKATYQYDNGTSFDEIMFKTTADQVVESSSRRFVSDEEKSNWSKKIITEEMNDETIEVDEPSVRTDVNTWLDFKKNGGEIGGTIIPKVDSETNLGSPTKKFQNIYANGWVFASNFRRKINLDTVEHGYSAGFGIEANTDSIVVGVGKNGNDDVLFPNKNNKMDLGIADSYVFKDLWLGISSRSINGYTKLPNKMILQWGTVRGNIGDFITTTLPVAFPNKTLVCGATVTKNCTSSHANMHLQAVFCSCQRWGNNLQIVFGSTSSLSDEFEADWFAIGY